jgi:hypothetical protein
VHLPGGETCPVGRASIRAKSSSATSGLPAWAQPETSADQETRFQRGISSNTLRASAGRPDLAYETMRWLERNTSAAWPDLTAAACVAAARALEQGAPPSRSRATSLRSIIRRNAEIWSGNQHVERTALVRLSLATTL